MPPLRLTSKHAIHTFLQQISVIYIFLAVLFSGIGLIEPHPEDGEPLPSDVQELLDSNEAAQNTMLVASSTLIAFSTFFSPGGPRGPYNQWLKCPEFFRGSLSYPDALFRKMFRLVVLASAVSLTISTNHGVESLVTLSTSLLICSSRTPSLNQQEGDHNDLCGISWDVS